MDPSDPSALIAELPDWNNGAGISAEAWIGCVGTFELAVGYSLVFWPRFVRVDGLVLREGFSPDALRSCAAGGADPAGVEALMNHLHIADLHCGGASPSEEQLRYLGRVLKEVHEAKLARDFPDLRFTVEFNDEPGLDPIDYQLTFWQP
ncbi:MAG TPA: hypothetical protein VF547_10680 [Allosphingosinicella sp.]|jgi:hypothetical protein